MRQTCRPHKRPGRSAKVARQRRAFMRPIAALTNGRSALLENLATSALDEQRRSQVYGEFAECHRLLIALKKEIVERVPNYYERHTETIKERSRNAKRNRD